MTDAGIPNAPLPLDGEARWYRLDVAACPTSIRQRGGWEEITRLVGDLARLYDVGMTGTLRAITEWVEPDDGGDPIPILSLGYQPDP